MLEFSFERIKILYIVYFALTCIEVNTDRSVPNEQRNFGYLIELKIIYLKCSVYFVLLWTSLLDYDTFWSISVS